MKVHSVVSLDIIPDEPIDGTVIGTFHDRENAIKECADYIIERLYLRADIRYAFMHDDNHPELKWSLSDRAEITFLDVDEMFLYDVNDDEWNMPPEVESFIKEWLVEEIKVRGYYEIEVDDLDEVIGSHEFVFKVIENQLKDESNG